MIMSSEPSLEAKKPAASTALTESSDPSKDTITLLNIVSLAISPPRWVPFLFQWECPFPDLKIISGKRLGR